MNYLNYMYLIIYVHVLNFAVFLNNYSRTENDFILDLFGHRGLMIQDR